MGYKYNVSCSETLSKKWTRQAVECYSINCICTNCLLYKLFFSKRNYKCKMKETVIELVRLIGVPKGMTDDV